MSPGHTCMTATSPGVCRVCQVWIGGHVGYVAFCRHVAGHTFWVCRRVCRRYVARMKHVLYQECALYALLIPGIKIQNRETVAHRHTKHNETMPFWHVIPELCPIPGTAKRRRDGVGCSRGFVARPLCLGHSAWVGDLWGAVRRAGGGRNLRTMKSTHRLVGRRDRCASPSISSPPRPASPRSGSTPVGAMWTAAAHAYTAVQISDLLFCSHPLIISA
jgi:hypothetical protein